MMMMICTYTVYINVYIQYTKEQQYRYTRQKFAHSTHNDDCIMQKYLKLIISKTVRAKKKRIADLESAHQTAYSTPNFISDEKIVFTSVIRNLCFCY